jgi:hypothetical protein
MGTVLVPALWNCPELKKVVHVKQITAQRRPVITRAAGPASRLWSQPLLLCPPPSFAVCAVYPKHIQPCARIQSQP